MPLDRQGRRKHAPVSTSCKNNDGRELRNNSQTQLTRELLTKCIASVLLPVEGHGVAAAVGGRRGRPAQPLPPAGLAAPPRPPGCRPVCFSCGHNVAAAKHRQITPLLRLAVKSAPLH